MTLLRTSFHKNICQFGAIGSSCPGRVWVLQGFFEACLISFQTFSSPEESIRRIRIQCISTASVVLLKAHNGDPNLDLRGKWFRATVRQFLFTLIEAAFSSAIIWRDLGESGGFDPPAMPIFLSNVRVIFTRNTLLFLGEQGAPINIEVKSWSKVSKVISNVVYRLTRAAAVLFIEKGEPRNQYASLRVCAYMLVVLYRNEAVGTCSKRYQIVSGLCYHDIQYGAAVQGIYCGGEALENGRL